MKSPLNGSIQLSVIVRKVRHEVYISIERHHQRFVSLAQHAAQELAPRILNRPEHVLFATRRIQQQRQRDGESHFLREKRDLLRLPILGKLEIFLLEVGDNVLAFIANRGKEIDEAYLRLDRRALRRGWLLTTMHEGSRIECGLRRARAERTRCFVACSPVEPDQVRRLP